MQSNDAQIRGTSSTLHLQLLVVGVGLACTPAWGQDGTDLANTFEREEFLELGPKDVPGKEKGGREYASPAATSKEEGSSEGQPPTPTPASEREWFGHMPWAKWGRITGDWGKARTHLEDNGITFNGSLTTDWGSVLKGGLREKGSSRTLLDLNVAFDLDMLVSLPGGTVYADWQSTDGRGGSEDVGDYMGVSNVYSGRNVHQLAELWYEQWLFNQRARIKLGKVDANLEFAYFKSATADFVSGGRTTPRRWFRCFRRTPIRPPA